MTDIIGDISKRDKAALACAEVVANQRLARNAGPMHPGRSMGESRPARDGILGRSL
jgi:hypothetical protein